MQDEAQLGRHLVQSGKLSEQELAEALARQRSLIMEGRAARLGELLVQGGKVAPEDIQAALASQHKKIGECDNCRARFNVAQWVANRIYRCGRCQTGTLTPVEDREVGVSGSHVMPAIGGAGSGGKPAARRTLGPIAILKELGRGGMGVVYQGYEEKLRRTVAVKVLLTADDEKLKARFLREARVVSRLRHPNIVAVHELGEADGRAYFTMDFIEGGPLNAQFAPERLPVRELVETIGKMARALDYAHRQGLVHRDVKPQNILVSTEGTPYLSDFGLAREVESATRLTMSGAIMGTPSYMSPEQARGAGGEVDGRTDIYSLGAVLYEGLTGRAPFDGKDLISLLEAIAKEEPRPPSQLVPGIPRDVETICLKALEKLPEKRYQTGEEMAGDIDRFLAGEPIHARRAGAVEKGARWIRRRAAVAAGAGAAVVVLVAAILIARAGSGGDPAEAERKLAEAQARVEEERRREKEEFAARVQDLEAQLAAAKTEEDRAKIAAQLQGLTGAAETPPETTGTTAPPKAFEWERRETEFRPLLAADRVGAAQALLHAWEPLTAEDRAKKEEWGAQAAARLADLLSGVRAAARVHEQEGRFAEGVAAWKAVRAWESPAATEESDIEIARLESLALAAAAKDLRRTELPKVRAAVAGALPSQDHAAALAAITGCEASFPALAADAADLRWIVDRHAEFRKVLFAAFEKGVELDLEKYGDRGTTLRGRDDGKIVVRLQKMGAELTIDPWKEIPFDRLVAIVRGAGGDEDAIALFTWFHLPPKGEDPKEAAITAAEVRRNRGVAREMAAKSQEQARLLAFLDAAASADPGGDPPPVVPPVDPPPGERCEGPAHAAGERD
ncbi:MAG: protein kinase, partial [Candidatus Brocadiae bacterium]|nr:protein kinase [Candidatus Brocadiia bacterium]